jgi:hypothetical protein
MNSLLAPVKHWLMFQARALEQNKGEKFLNGWAGKEFSCTLRISLAFKSWCLTWTLGTQTCPKTWEPIRILEGENPCLSQNMGANQKQQSLRSQWMLCVKSAGCGGKLLKNPVKHGCAVSTKNEHARQTMSCIGQI